MPLFEVIDIPKPDTFYENPKRYKPVSIVVFSDTHNRHEELEVPDGDILLHCGDFRDDTDFSDQSSRAFNLWLGTLPHRHKIVICGNHETDFPKFTKQHIQSRILTNYHYLDDELIEVEGILIYGCSWAFKGDEPSKWASIPANIDILMTHIPPKFILDLAYEPRAGVSKEPCKMCNNVVHGIYQHWGSENLARDIFQRIKPKIHCFGHVHDDQGYRYQKDVIQTMSINAATDFTKTCFKFTFYVDLERNKTKSTDAHPRTTETPQSFFKNI
jgi:hypothetical protein